YGCATASFSLCCEQAVGSKQSQNNQTHSAEKELLMSVQTESMQAKAATVVLPAAGQPMNILGHQATLKLTSSDTRGDGYLFDLVTPPGLGIPPHVHQLEDEYIYVLEGTFEIFLGGKTYEASQGTLLYFPRYTAHGFRNIGAGAGRTLWTVVPGG